MKVSTRRRFRILQCKARQKFFRDYSLSRYIELDERIENTRDGVEKIKDHQDDRILALTERLSEVERRLSWSEYYAHHSGRKS